MPQPVFSTSSSSACVSVASSSSPRRRRGLRTATSSSANDSTTSANNNKSFLLSRSVGSFSSSQNNKHEKLNTSSSGSASRPNSDRWPQAVSPTSGDDITQSSGKSLFGEVWQAAPSTTSSSGASSSSPRSVASMRSRRGVVSPPSRSSGNRSVKSSASSSRRSPKSSNGVTRSEAGNSSSSRSVVSAVRASPNHSSLELTTVAEDATMSAGSTATGDSFILQLDDEPVALVDDNGFLLNYHAAAALLDDSFEDPYLQSKQDMRLRKKKSSNYNDDDDERDYFCNATSCSKTKIPRRRSGITLDTECSTGGATSAAADAADVDALNSSSLLAVRYIAGETEEKKEQEYHRHNHPPLSRLDGIPSRKHFHETDEVSVPSQNEQHGGDVSCFDNHHHHHGGDEEAEASAPLLTIDYGASLDSIEVDDRQGILMENSVSCHETARQRQRQARDAHALYYWNTLLTARIMNFGQEHFKTAETWLELGNAHLEAKEYNAALGAYTCAQRIFHHYYPHRPVALARALDRMGVACSKTARHIDPSSTSMSMMSDDDELTPEEVFSKAIDWLLEALQIRYDELGPWHVDTVDCLNHLAWVQYDAGLYNQARRSFWEVFFCRKAIFGSPHPGVAVAAHDLANCFFKLGRLSDADNFYSVALEIFDNMNVRIQNPAVARLLRDMKRLERLQKSF